MNFTRRIIALLLSMTMALSLLTGCNGELTDEQIINKASQDPASYLSDKIVSNDDVLVTVGDKEVPASYYMYWVSYYLSQVSTYYTYYGQEFDLTSEISSGVTIADYVEKMAYDATKGYAAMELIAQDYNVTLDDETLETAKTFAESQDENALLYYATNTADQEQIYLEYQYGLALKNQLFGNGGEFAPTDEELQNYITENGIINCRYILYSVDEDATDEEAAEAQAQCQAAYDELSQLEGDALIARFKEYQANNADGNTDEFSFDSESSLTDGFREKLETMAINELGMTDKTGYGYFVVLRLEPDMEEVSDDYISDNFSDKMDELSANYEVVNSEKYDKLDASTICTNVLALQTAIENVEAAQADASSSVQ